MNIKWDATLETGHRQIDLQHRELVELINEASAGYAAGRRSEVLQDILPRLTAYVMFHFGTEESLMARYALPGSFIVTHQAAHQAFADRVAEMKKNLDAGGEDQLGPLLEYLKSWLVDHIMRADRELVRQLPAFS